MAEPTEKSDDLENLKLRLLEAERNYTEAMKKATTATEAERQQHAEDLEALRGEIQKLTAERDELLEKKPAATAEKDEAAAHDILDEIIF